MEIEAGLFLEVANRIPERAVVHRVHAVEQIAGPARARLQHDDLDRGEPLEQAVLEHRGKRLQRTLRTVHVVVPERPLLHVLEPLVDALGRRLAAGMDADRHVEFLRLGPERVVVGVGVRNVGGGERHEERALAAGLHGPLQFSGGLVAVAHRDVRNRNQAAVRVGAELDHPAVVRTRERGLQFQVFDVLGLPQQAEARIDDRLVQAFTVHALEAFLGIHGPERRLTQIRAVRVRRGFLLRGLAHRAELGQLARWRVLGGAAVQFEDFKPVLVRTQTNCAVAELRIDVFFPGIGRFEDVAVGVDRAGIRKRGGTGHRGSSVGVKRGGSGTRPRGAPIAG